MKLYGYKEDALSPDDIVPSELAEITLLAAPFELRKIARFLTSAAEGMEHHGKNWEHEHLSDVYEEFSDSSQFIVFNPEANE